MAQYHAMKITRLETFHVRPRWLFLKIHTDKDIVGWGEPVLEGKANATNEVVQAAAAEGDEFVEVNEAA